VSRDVVLLTTLLVLCSAGTWVLSWVPARLPAESRFVSGRRLERRSWRHLWFPVLPAAVVLATMCGWALQEPSVTDEPLRGTAVLVALPFALLWLRCVWRAGLALRRPRSMPALATHGLLRPRIAIAERLRSALDPAALAAAIAHEEAHVRHFDPLRIWLAQIVTDMQWPSPTARRRLDQWLSALELARDEEARIEGTSGADLAAAVVAVAKMTPSRMGAHAVAGLTGAEASLASRIHRLLDPVPPDQRRPSLIPLAVIASLVVGIVVGVEFGDSLLRALPFIAT